MRIALISAGLLLAGGACEPAGSTRVSAATTPPAPTPSAAPGAPADSALRRIREHVAAIERELPSYRCRTLDLDGFSTEGGELHACYAGDQLRRLTARHFGETGQVEEQFVFVGRQPEFVLRIRTTYATPFPNPSGIRERTEERFYFLDGRLVQSVGPDGAPRSVTTPEARQEGAEQMETARRLAACARDPRLTVCMA